MPNALLKYRGESLQNRSEQVFENIIKTQTIRNHSRKNVTILSNEARKLERHAPTKYYTGTNLRISYQI